MKTQTAVVTTQQDINICRGCLVELTDDNWQPGVKKQNKKWCACCSNSRAAKWKQDNPEKVKLQKKKWLSDNKDKILQYREKVTKQQTRQYQVKGTYNLSWEEYVKLYDQYKGSCGICKTPLSLVPSDTTMTAHVDHNHKTNKVRGLLCRSCNRGIGYLNDSSERLQAAAIYLQKYED